MGCITLHPSGLPHGPQPGAVEKALGKTSTDELAVMWDTFRPLRLSTLWQRSTSRSTRTPGIPESDDRLDVHPAELTAGHVQHLAVHVVRPRRAEEEHRAGGLLG